MKFGRCLLILLLGVSSSFAQAQVTVIDSLRTIIQENKQDAEENKALNALASEYTRTDMAKAKTYLYMSIVLSGNLKNALLLSYAWSQMVTLQINTGRADSAQYYLLLLRKLAGASDQSGVKASYNFAAGLFYRKQGNFKEALPYMLECLNEYIAMDKNNPSTGIRVSIAGQNLNIGNTYLDLGEYKNALHYHLKALQIFEETGNKRGQSFCYQSIGSDFIQLDQYSQALPYTQKAIALKEELNDKRGIATARGELGTIYMGLSQYDRALEYFRSDLGILQEMKLTPEQAKANFEIGKVYVLKKDPAHATSYFQKSKLLARQIGDSSQAAAVDAELISLHTSISKQQFAADKLISGLKTSIEMGDKSTEVLSYQYLSDHYASNGQFEKALVWSNKFHQVSDSLQSKDVQLQIKRLEENYNLEKKEQEIVLLKKDQQLSRLSLQKEKTYELAGLIFLLLLLVIGFLIATRSRMMSNSRRVIEMERMRNNIARDLHDDIGSTLTSINILSKIALEQAHGQGDTMIAPNLQKIKDRSSAIMESVGDIVWAINPKNDTIEKMIFRMKEFSSEILDPLKINFSFREEGDFSSIKLDIRKRKDFYLLFKEAINNAAKYSECRNLDIHLSQDDQFLRLKVTDDGTGFDQELAKNGNGLDNMRQRAHSMQASIHVETAIGKGTGIRLDVPIE
ncbi:MAG TPA: tetratricopeptide repeat protein [Puia sp.]|nr:tetratricopeptide repeat protein [Puia sp.]